MLNNTIYLKKRSAYFLLSVLFLITCNLVNSELKAQDVHFSQNYATPLYLNPAMTGLFQGDLRLAAVYRNQWNSVMPGVPFRTIAASADMAFQGIGTNDRFAAGLLLYNDRAGSLSWMTNYIDAALAYNLGISEKAYVSLGIEAGVTQRSFDLSNAQFGDQSDGLGFDPNIATNDIIGQTANWAMNIGAGGMFYMTWSRRTNIYLGAAMYHFTQPDISFTGIERDNYAGKLSLQLGGSYQLSEKIDLLPSIYYLQQANFLKIDMGSFVRFVIDSDRRTGLDRAFNLGAWLRVGNSVLNDSGLNTVILAGKVDYNNFSVGISYDLTAFSELAAVNSGRGGAELAVIYTAKTRPDSDIMYCPRF